MKFLLSAALVLFFASANAQTSTDKTQQTVDKAKAAPTAAKTAATPVVEKAAAEPAKAVAPKKAKKAKAAAAEVAPTAQTAPAAPVAPTAPVAPATPATPTADTTPDAATIEASLDQVAEQPSQKLNLPSGILANLGVTYFSRDMKDDDRSIDSKINTLAGELKAGYVFDFGLFAGATFHYDSGKANSNSVTTMYGGPTLGYSCGITGLLATATYHVFGSVDADAAGKYDKVEGIQIDLSYPMSISEKLKFGPQLSWRDLDQKESDTLADEKTKELVPFMGVWYIF